MDIRDFKVIDMKRSEIDKEKSDPKKDYYEFTKKVYYKEFEDGAFGPYHFYWERDTEKGYEIQQAKYKGCSLVSAPKNGIPDYWPEPVQRNESGNYVYMDSILMKWPMNLYLAKRKEDAEASIRAPLEKQREFKNLLNKDGVSVDDKTLARVLGIDRTRRDDPRVTPHREGGY